MGILDEAREVQKEANPGPKCGVAKWLETLDADTRREAEEMFADKSLTATTCATVAQRHGGDKVTAGVAAHHRKANGCACPRG